MIVYAKNAWIAKFRSVVLDPDILKTYTEIDSKWKYRLNNYLRSGGWDDNLRINKQNFWYPIYVSRDLKTISIDIFDDSTEIWPITWSWQERTWKTSKDTFWDRLKAWEILASKSANWEVWIFEKYREDQVIKTHWIDKRYNAINQWTKIIDALLEGKFFDFPKSVYLVLDILKLTTQDNDIVLDFFSGSWTTAHATFELNIEDGWKRRFIMVQIPEEVSKDNPGFKKWYTNICKVWKERIRRAGRKIIEENKDKEGIEKLDTGFRVYRLDSSNMKDVFYHPTEVTQAGLFELTSNIKDDRTPEDILSQVMLDLGLTLDLPIETRMIAGSTVFLVAGNSLVACFDEEVDFSIVDELAQLTPLKVVFRDSSFASDADRINFETRFKKFSPDSDLRVI